MDAADDARMQLEEPGQHDVSVALLTMVAELTLEDVNNLQSMQKGKASASMPLSDLELALRLQEEEAQSLLDFTRDHQIARGLESALEADYLILKNLEKLEDTARRDREAAVALSEGRPLPPRSPSPPPNDVASTSDRPDNGAEESVHEELQSDRPPSRASIIAGPSWSNRAVEKHDCVICTTVIGGIAIRAPCGHFYDQGCLTDLFKATINDESLYPPRCCQRPFVLSEVQSHLGPDLCALFEKKAAEFGTADRVYCHRRECSAFIGAATSEASSLRCSECASETCARCKAAAHSSTVLCDPSLSAEDEVVLALAGEAGWTRCPKCRQLVELTLGCFHITCRCRAEFCYVCAVKWKQCGCPVWEERRLEAAAEHRIQREHPQVAPAAPNYRRMVVREAERLRWDHECAHERWSFRNGGGRCEHCGHTLPRYLFRCRGCQTLACNRCRRNRL